MSEIYDLHDTYLGGSRSIWVCKRKRGGTSSAGRLVVVGVLGRLGERKKRFTYPDPLPRDLLYNLTMNATGIMSQHLQVEVLAPSRGHIMLCRIWIS